MTKRRNDCYSFGPSNNIPTLIMIETHNLKHPGLNLNLHPKPKPKPINLNPKPTPES
jgi:hypothetical protein